MQPKRVYRNNCIEWWIEVDCIRLRHRKDGPAVEFISGEKQWFVNGRIHRIDGPAIEAATLSWWYIYSTSLRLLDFKSTLALLNHVKSKAQKA